MFSFTCIFLETIWKWRVTAICSTLALGWATTVLLCPGCCWLPVTAVLFSSRCSLSKVSASPCYLLPAFPPGSPASALCRLRPASCGAAAAGAGSPHGPGTPAQRPPAPDPDARACPALPGCHRALLPTSGATPAIPPPAAAPRGTAPPAHAPSQVRGSCSSQRIWKSCANITVEPAVLGFLLKLTCVH